MKLYLTYKDNAESVFEKLTADGTVLPFSAHYKDGARVIHDKNTGLFWEIKSPDSSAVNFCDDTYTFEGAKKYAEKLNAEKYCGFSDWRVPNKDELRSVVDYEKSGLAIDDDIFEYCKATDYWTENVYNMQPYFAWVIFFGLGSGIAKSVNTEHCVMAVRGGGLFGKAAPERFVDNGDGTVTDKATGLMWQQGENNRMPLEQAAKACSEMTLAGYNDWRLPNIKEINTIINLDYTDNWWYFKNVFPANGLKPPLLHYFTSTEFMGVYAWVVNFCFGYDGYYGGKQASLLFRAVRSTEESEIKPFTVTHTGETRKFNVFGEPAKPDECVGLDCDRVTIPLSFTTLDKTTVKDNNTGLVWSFSDGGVHTWADALEYASRCNSEKLFGRTNWRLPSREELRSIVIYDDRTPAVDTDYFKGVTPDFYWTGETEKNVTTMAWTTYFGYGCCIALPKNQQARVMLVSGEKDAMSQMTAAERFDCRDDGTVLDKATGLMWMRGETPLLTLEGALKYCRELRLGGYDDWALPNMKELGTLINLSEGKRWFFKEIFPDSDVPPQSFYMSSTTFDATFGWGCNFLFGFDGYYADRRRGEYPFRPVRNTRK